MSIWKLSKKFVLCCVLFIGGILLLIQAFIHMADDKKAPMDYNAISVSDINKNAIISGEIEETIGWYVTITKNGRPDYYYYAVPVDQDKYMGIRVNASEAEILEQIENGENVTLSFRGKITETSTDYREQLEKLVANYGYTSSEAKDHILPYHIEVIHAKASDIFLEALIIMFVSGVTIFIFIKKGWYIDK